MHFNQFIRFGLALVTTGSLALSGCSSVQDVATGVGDISKDAMTTTGEAALAPAVNPVLDLLKTGESEVQAGNLAAAVATLKGFQPLWEKTAPVIKPLAGDKWPMIETAAKLVLSTFDAQNPDPAAASSALNGLIGPLSSLIGQ